MVRVIAVVALMASSSALLAFGPPVAQDPVIIPGDKITKSCSFVGRYAPTTLDPDGNPIPNDLIAYPPSDVAKKWLADVVTQLGITASSFELMQGSVDNAMAVVLGSQRLIFYNLEWLESIVAPERQEKNWAAIGVIAHEIGHHLQGHPLDDSLETKEKYRTELEADSFAGFQLFNMDATLKQALAAVEAFATDAPSQTHPKKADRKAAVTRGWERARDLAAAKARERASQAAIEAKYDVDVTQGVAPLQVRFTDRSVGPVATRSWDFGDGESSSEPNPTHVYRRPGNYTARLTVRSSDQREHSSPKAIAVHEKLSAIISATPTTGPAPLEVRFTDRSVGDVKERDWDFGDEKSSRLSSPVHTYRKAGTYEARLTISDGAQTTSATTTIVVVDKPREPDVPKVPTVVGPVFLGAVHNIVVSGANGVGFTLTGQLRHAGGKTVQLVARFAYVNPMTGLRTPLFANPAEQFYRDAFGYVAAGTVVWPAASDSIDLSNRTVTPQLNLMMPYYALNIANPTPGPDTFTIFTFVEFFVDGRSVFVTPEISWPYTL